METQTRKYQKHKTEYKITVKHYLHKKIVYTFEDADRYPVYIQLTYQRKTTVVKSKYNKSLTDAEFKALTEPMPDFLLEEVEQVKTIIERVTHNGRIFETKRFSDEYNRLNVLLTEVVDNNLKREMAECLKALTLANYRTANPHLDESEFVEGDYSPIADGLNWSKEAGFLLNVFLPLIPELSKVSARYSPEIWNFRQFYQKVQLKFSRHYTWFDYKSGRFISDLIATLKDKKGKEVTNIIQGLSQLLDS